MFEKASPIVAEQEGGRGVDSSVYPFRGAKVLLFCGLGKHYGKKKEIPGSPLCVSGIFFFSVLTSPPPNGEVFGEVFGEVLDKHLTIRNPL